MRKNVLSNSIGFAVLNFGLISTGASAHGFVSEEGITPSRNALCGTYKLSGPVLNQNCGSVQWDVQSVEGPDGFPEAGPADGQLASGGNAAFSSMDEQTENRWHKTEISSGHNIISWHHTAPHVTKDWKYYITKNDWNPNAPLTRDQLDLVPFCEYDGGMVQPAMEVQHACDIPEREGYHVILAVWDVGDTANAFYNAIDVQFTGEYSPTPPPGSEPDWNKIGSISTQVDLNIGDKVYTRVFDEVGEVTSLSTTLTITPSTKEFSKWSYALSTKINEERSEIQAGPLNLEGASQPVYGTNPIYTLTDSGYTSVELGYDIVEQPKYDVSVTGLESTYIISDRPTVLDFDLTATGDVIVEMNVFNSDNLNVASKSVEMFNGVTKTIMLELSSSEVGEHQLQGLIKTDKGEFVKQSATFFRLINEQGEIPGEYDFMFPHGLAEYKEGTRVLAEDGSVYECRGWPYSGYCTQWSESATHYQPGAGSHWSEAWTKVD